MEKGVGLFGRLSCEVRMDSSQGMRQSPGGREPEEVPGEVALLPRRREVSLVGLMESRVFACKLKASVAVRDSFQVIV